MKPRTVDLARGKWRGILLALGVPATALTGKHGPCPLPACTPGTDRFRWDNKGGDGSFICSACGAGNGFVFLQRFKGWEFATAAAEVDKIVGNVSAEPAKRDMPPERVREALNGLWRSGEPVRAGDQVSAYLAGRGLALPQNADCLRFVERCPVPGGGVLPAMVAMVTGLDGKPATLHRTYLGPAGKAEIDTPRALMPGSVPEGAAIRLAMHGERLGIAEGIETALAASAKFNWPVWAAISSSTLAKWQPPEGVQRVMIFGDNDKAFGGAAAAYALAHRLATRTELIVDVAIPRVRGMDWADEEAA